MAIDYLREVLGDRDGAPPPETAREPLGTEPRGLTPPADPGGAARRREWSRRWTRLRLPDLLAAYSRELAAARTTDEIYSLVAAHAVRIVGAFTCLLFVPGEGEPPFRGPGDGRLNSAPGGLHIPHLRRRRRVTIADTRDPGARFAGLAPLFERDRAALLACAPFGERGAVVLVERRRDRVFGREDWELLSVLASLGHAALRRAEVMASIPELGGACPVTGLAGRAQVGTALEHAWELVGEGEAMTVVVLSLEGLTAAETRFGAAAAERLVRTVGDVVRECLPADGIALRYGPAEFVLTIPGATPAAAAAMVSQFRGRLAASVEVHAGIAGAHPGAAGPRDLLLGALAAIPSRPRGRA
jgi:GGDEF domain-containing protein